ncbi:MAG TPA: sigma-70 family RNA polymerase sigma factor [Gammaproteobacteria bacterium]
MPENTAREEEERRLVARIVRRETAALERLYHGLRPRLRRFLLAMGCPEPELDEACNETFYVVWRRAASYDGISRVSTWIFGIARNKAMDLRRQQRRRAATRAETSLDEVPEPRLAEADRLELQQWLEVALARLPEDQRTVLELAFIEGLSYQEIAAVMDCPENTVKTRMFHARRKLKHGFPEFANGRHTRNAG